MNGLLLPGKRFEGVQGREVRRGEMAGGSNGVAGYVELFGLAVEAGETRAREEAIKEEGADIA